MSSIVTDNSQYHKLLQQLQMVSVDNIKYYYDNNIMWANNNNNNKLINIPLQ